jgi:hypothetical protein
MAKITAKSLETSIEKGLLLWSCSLQYLSRQANSLYVMALKTNACLHFFCPKIGNFSILVSPSLGLSWLQLGNFFFNPTN